MLEDTAAAGRQTLPSLRVGAVVATAIAAAFVTWLVMRHESNTKPVAQAPAREAPQLASPTAPVRVAPQLVSTAQLHALAAKLDHPLYWAGGRLGVQYELTDAGSGRTYIRYLPANVTAGDPRARFLAVGTYAEPGAFANIEAAGKRPGAVTINLPLGGIAVYDAKRPTSVYFANPDSNVQVEVYAPNARLARRLVVAGQVVPIK
jgi:hypothetical protein